MMKATGVVRKLDSLGRIVIPKELRNAYDVNIGDSLEIFVDDDTVILKKYEPACTLCGNASNTIHFKGKNLCRGCLEELKDL